MVLKKLLNIVSNVFYHYLKDHILKLNYIKHNLYCHLLNFCIVGKTLHKKSSQAQTRERKA